MKTPLHVLIIEDIEDEALLLKYELERNGCAVVCERVDTAAATEAALRRQAWDVVICDYSLPHFDFSAALALVKAFDPDLPFILVSGTVGEEIAVACMKAGAHDYVMKNNLHPAAPRDRTGVARGGGTAATAPSRGRTDRLGRPLPPAV